MIFVVQLLVPLLNLCHQNFIIIKFNIFLCIALLNFVIFNLDLILTRGIALQISLFLCYSLFQFFTDFGRNERINNLPFYIALILYQKNVILYLSRLLLTLVSLLSILFNKVFDEVEFLKVIPILFCTIFI